MADIQLAQRVGAQGVSKTVAIKRLRPELSDDRGFVQRFLNEARITVDLSHGNVTSVFEIGEASGSYFLAMEYVRGWDLSRVLTACSRSERFVPLNLALHIVIEITKALGYAHTKKNASGELREIVHRDVNPGNVLVSTEGEVKLTDFGIARAAAYAMTTSSTWLVGKIPYMSPEQSTGQRVDARSDLFSLGIVLWELVTVRRLFKGDDEKSLLNAVREANVPPPSALREGVPEDVDALAVRALARSPRDRYQSARELQSDLSRALAKLEPVGASDLREFLDTLELPPPPDPAALAESAEAGATPSELLVVNRVDRTSLVDEVSLRAAAAPADRDVEDDASVVSDGTAGAAAAPRPPSSASSRRAPPRVWMAVGVAALTAALAGGVRWRWGSDAHFHAVRLEVRTRTPGTIVYVDGVERGTAPLVLEHLARERVEVRLASDGYRPLERAIDFSESPDVVIDADLERLP